MFAPIPVCGLKYVIADTMIISISVSIKFLYFSFIFYFSSFIINGMANIMNPINSELWILKKWFQLNFNNKNKNCSATNW